MSLTMDLLMERGDTPLTPDDVMRFRSHGYWQGRTIRSVLTDAAARHPEREALVGYRSDGRVERWTYHLFDAQATQAASCLAALGVHPGEAVAVMLPNWIEYPAIIFGINETGAIYTGIPVSYGDRQAAAILRTSRATVLVIPRRWRGQEHLALSRRLRKELPGLEHVIVLDDDGEDLQEGEWLWASPAGAPPATAGPAASTEVCYLGFTSGTTGEPKGAMHTAESLLYSVHQLAEHVGPANFGDPMVQLVVSPTGHHTGWVWGVLFTTYLAGTGIHVDRWDPAWGVDIIRKERITTFFGAPTFLQDMMRTDLAGDKDCPLRCLVIAGSSVPRNLPRQASKALGAYIAPAWGMTECSIIVSCTPAEPDGILLTDGSVFAGSGVRITDPFGNPAPPGAVGNLEVNGPALFLGYFERPDATEQAFTEDGWFRTGDTARQPKQGWISLEGRTKDIIIRGGENIPVAEIETLIFDHPDVLNTAVVGLPDERLGERACAVVVLRPESELDLAGLCAYLLERGLSKHYLPERLVVMEEIPMTQSGKIQKFELRGLLSG
jgi:cyclohexanecarboxylate-CoA ligase